MADWRSSFDTSWRLIPRKRRKVVHFGLLAEAAWFDIYARQALGEDPDWDLFDIRIDAVLDHGFDWEIGGTRHSFLNRAGTPESYRTKKTFWAQAEMIAALSLSCSNRNVPRHRDALRLQLGFVQKHMADEADGVWIEVADDDGSPQSPGKSNMWKAGYHEVRALVMFIESFPSDLSL